MKSVPFTRIRFRILGIVLLALIPASLLICLSAAERKKQVSDEIEGNIIRLSRFLASNLERDLSEGEGYLRAIAEVVRGRRFPGGTCSETLHQIAGDSSIYSNIGISDRRGASLCSANPDASFSGLGAMDWFRDLDSASGLSIGFDFNSSHGSGSSIILVLPVSAVGIGAASGRSYVFALMDLEWLNRLAESSRLPPGSAISITNRKGDAVARYPEPEKWVGKSRQSGDDLRNRNASEGVLVAEGIDGVRRFYAYTKVHGKGGLVVNVGVSREAILEPAARALRNQLAALGIVALMAVLAAWFGADLFLLKQVRTLIKATRQLGAGNLQARSMLSYDSGELGELAKAFDEMAETLEWRDAQLRESEVEREDPLAMLPALAECMPEPFIIMDESFLILSCNREASRLLGLRNEELIGQSLYWLFPDIPVGEITGLIATPPGLDRLEVRRLRTETARHRESAGRHPVHVDISLTKAVMSNRTFLLALMKQILEPIQEA
jgi:PAS domain S-box-containing protein